MIAMDSKSRIKPNTQLVARCFFSVTSKRVEYKNYEKYDKKNN